MILNTNQEAFFELLRAGLWEKEARLAQFDNIDYATILQLAEKQSVVGLVTAGLEHVSDMKVPQEWVLQFVGETLQIEQQNKEMNAFIEKLIKKLRDAGVYTLLVKGQGIAQCYEKPLWRASGDVDLLLDELNYKKAKRFMIPMATSVDEEDSVRLHLGMTIDGWVVELHGTLREPLLMRVNNGLDEVQKDTIDNKRTREWTNGETIVYLPYADNDVVFVFAHILQHYFGGGVGLRQICDWCRLMWRYYYNIDVQLLSARIVSMGLITEWQVFCAYAVEYLGTPRETMLLFNGNPKWTKKANLMNPLIMSVGNFGQGRDQTYYQTRPYLVRKAISFKYRLSDAYTNFTIFPKDSIVTFLHTFTRGMKTAIQGKY